MGVGSNAEAAIVRMFSTVFRTIVFICVVFFLFRTGVVLVCEVVRTQTKRIFLYCSKYVTRVSDEGAHDRLISLAKLKCRSVRVKCER